MRPYQNWLSAGLLVLVPGLVSSAAVAGALDGPQMNPALRSGPPPSRAVAVASQSNALPAAEKARNSRAAANQELADKVAKALSASKLNGYDIDIDVRDGVVVLDGFVTRTEQRSTAAKVARSVRGVTSVNNRLKVGEPPAKTRADQSALGRGQSPEIDAPVEQTNYVQRAGFQPGGDQMVANPPPPPSQPYMVPYSGTTYSQNGTYVVATAGPAPCPAGAWPYNGPFQPYPQAPLGWRKITMQWDEGLWTLDFGSRKRGLFK